MVEYAPVEKIKLHKDERSLAYRDEICLRPYQLKEVQRFVNSKPKTSTIVELGAGGGHFSAWMFNQGFNNIHCVDVDNYLVHPELKKRFQKINLSMEKLPFKNNSVDGVIAIEVIEHLDNMTWCIKEIGRILKPNGWFLMTIPNIANLRRRITFLLTGDNLLVSEGNDHMQNITDALVKKLVKAHFGKGARSSLLRYPVKFPLLRFNMPYIDLLADNRIYIVEKGSS